MTVQKIRLGSISSSNKGVLLNVEEVDSVMATSLEEVYEETSIPGTSNIIMKVKKYILPIENIRNTTYTVE